LDAVRYVGAAAGSLWRKYMNPLQLRKAESTSFEDSQRGSW
jgi:hypothetical protein